MIVIVEIMHQLGYSEVNEVKVGKIVRLDIDETDADKAKLKAEEMAEKLLYNSNVESFRVVIPRGGNA